MNLKEVLIRARDGYIYNQVMKVALPDFPGSAPVRYRMIFSGKVQNVGFRYETELMAQRLGLTGFCMNLENGDVLAELQGLRSKIEFYIRFMQSLKRMRIDHVRISELPVNSEEREFQRDYLCVLC